LVSENISEQEANQIRHRILNALGADVDYASASDVFNKFIGSVGKLKKEVKDSGPAFKNLSKEYRTGFTFQEQYDRGLERLEHNSKSLTAQLGVQSTVLRNQRKAIKLVTGEIRDMAMAHRGKDGAINQLEGGALAANIATRSLLAFNTAGLQGVAIESTNMLKELRPVEKLFRRLPGQTDESASSLQGHAERLAEQGQVALAILPALSESGINMQNLNATVQLAMGPLGMFNRMLGGMPGRLLGILGPIGLVAGGAYLIHKNYDGGLKGFGKMVIERLGQGIDMAKSYLEKNGPAIASSIETGFASALEFMTDGAGGQLLSRIGNFAGDMLVKGLNKGAEVIASADSSGAGQKIGAFIFSGLEKIGSIAWNAITGAFEDPGSKPAAQTTADTIGAKIADGLSNLGSAVLRSLGDGIAGMVNGGIDYIMDGNVSISDKVKSIGMAVGGAFVLGFGLSLAGGAMGSGLMGAVGRGLMAPARLAGRGAIAAGRRVGGGIGGRIRGSRAGQAVGRGMSRARGFASRNAGRLAGGGFALAAAGYGAMSYLQENKPVKTKNVMDQSTADGQRVAGAILAGIDSVLMGLPSMFVGYIFGSTKKAKVVLKQFYNFLVAEAEKTMFDFKLAFETLPPLVKLGASKMMGFFERFYYGVGIGIAKATATLDEKFSYMVGLGKDVAFGLRTKFSLFFDSLQAGGTLAVQFVEDLFIGMKDTIINDAIAPILQKLQNLAQSLPSGMLASAGIDTSFLNIADNLGLGEKGLKERQEKRRLELQERATKTEEKRFNRLYSTAIELGVPASALSGLTTSAQLRSFMDTYDPGNAAKMAEDARRQNETTIGMMENEAAKAARDRAKYESGLTGTIQSSVNARNKMQQKIDADLSRQMRIEESGGFGSGATKPMSKAGVKPVGNIPSPAKERQGRDGVDQLKNANQKGFKDLGERFSKDIDRLIAALGGMKPVRTAGTSVTSDMTAYT
jgi:hypothetical protein